MARKLTNSGFSPLIILLIILLLAGGGFVGYRVLSKEDKAPAASTTTKTKTETKEEAKAETKTTTAPTAEALENIKASITSENTAALEGYMAASVNVILAATEAYGPRTPTEAVGDVDYVKDGTDWDFALPAATLDAYQAGDYKQYFPETALVGKSAEGHVISFQFNDSGKISGIFMSNHDIL